MVNEARKRGMVVIAQLAEHRIVVPSVVGSSPTLHPQTSFGMSFLYSGLYLAVRIIGYSVRFSKQASYTPALPDKS